MGLPNVNIELTRDGLGLVATTSDNTCGIIVPGAAVDGILELGKPFSIYSTEGAKRKGITSDVNPMAYRHISEFYARAGEGAKLWVLVAPPTAKLSELVDTDLITCPARALVNTAGGEIVALGLTSATDNGATVDGLDSEVYSAMLKGQLLADNFSNKIMPYVTIIEGRKFIGDADLLRDLGTESKYRMAITLQSTQTDGSASVGLVLGAIAALSVQRKISRVKNGALPIETSYLSDGLPVKGREDLGTIHDKRFIITRQFPGKSGYFFNGDFTATSPTDDLNTISRVRPIDKATKIAYNTYIEELDDDVEVNDDGTLDASVAAYLQDKIGTQVSGNMTGEISSFTANVDTTIDILSGLPQKIYLYITPKGYLNPIVVVIGYRNE